MMTDRLLLLSTCWWAGESVNLLFDGLSGNPVICFGSTAFIYLLPQATCCHCFPNIVLGCVCHNRRWLLPDDTSAATGGWFLSAHFSLLHRLSVSFPPSWKFSLSLSLSLCLTVSSLRSCQLCSLSSSLRLLSQISVFVHGGVTHRAAACPDLQRRLMLW